MPLLPATLTAHPTDQASSQFWPAVLACRRYLTANTTKLAGFAYLAEIEGQWQFQTTPPAKPARAIIALPLAPVARPAELDGLGGQVPLIRGEWSAHGLSWLDRDGSPAELPPCLQIYLPVVLGPIGAARQQRLFVTGHLAQTLDGRIACANGHSQWIGNAANLTHAHRLRALHDAVLVGSRTAARDNPQLTVRHCTGDDPRRVLLNGSASALRHGHGLHLFDARGCTLLCRADANAPRAETPSSVDVVPIAGTPGAWIDPPAVATALRQRGIRSLFIEGGSKTLSLFLEHGGLDQLHLHIAPIVLGSGVPSLSLPEVGSIDQGRRFEVQHFTFEGELLVVCDARGRSA